MSAPVSLQPNKSSHPLCREEKSNKGSLGKRKVQDFTQSQSPESSQMDLLNGFIQREGQDSLTTRIIQVFGKVETFRILPKLEWNPKYRTSKYIDNIQPEDMPIRGNMRAPVAWGVVDIDPSKPPNLFIAMNTQVVNFLTAGVLGDPSVETIHMIKDKDDDTIKWTSGGTPRIVKRGCMTEEEFADFKTLLTKYAIQKPDYRYQIELTSNT
ncbi:MAG: hypothetical protein V4487_04660 [Chlamydiota bacterium]